MQMKKMLLGGLASAAVAVAVAAPAHADNGLRPSSVRCHVGGGGELWCEDMDTGRSWEEAPGGSYPYPPCNWANPHCYGG
jgi:hypothetical protein